eukprot:TRINITY_DN8446_c0_g1_i1.p1 TRINITY_DN8446_c0_g1~~TRINITY_DN8446_c0_g1_i1.p1  ORF type:complete len:271 (+),score=62.75 TRINITY_DN8446_c0_g1_i1:162-974(+)
MDSADDLVGMLQTLGTEDRPVLMQRLMELCPDLSPEAAQFFLEANNWNLAEAAGSYFEQGGSRAVVTQAQPEAELVCDVTFGDGEPVPPDTIFDKTWRLRNVGQEAWPRNTLLVFAQGDRIQLENEIRVPSLAPGQAVDLTVKMQSPKEPGQYAASFRLCQNNGYRAYFGEPIWVVVTVDDAGTLPLLQQMAATSFNMNGHSQETSHTAVFSYPSQGPVGGPAQQQQHPSLLNTYQQPTMAPGSWSLSNHTFGNSPSRQYTQQDDQSMDT